MLPNAKAIVQALDDVPLDSDISGCGNDSGDDKTYVPREDHNIYSSGKDDKAEEEPRDRSVLLEGQGDVGGDEPLPAVDPPAVPVGPADLLYAGAAGPPHAKRRKQVKELTIWVKKDVPPQQLPISTVKPRNMQDCKLDVNYF